MSFLLSIYAMDTCFRLLFGQSVCVATIIIIIIYSITFNFLQTFTESLLRT